MNKRLLFFVIPSLLLTACTSNKVTSSSELSEASSIVSSAQETSVISSVNSQSNEEVISSSASSSVEEKKEMTKEDLSTVFGDVAEKGLDKLGLKDAIAKPSARKFPIDGESLTDPSASEYKAVIGNMGSSLCMVQLISDLYKREEFVISNKIVNISYYSSVYNANVDYYFLPVVDVENNKIYVETESFVMDMSIYFYMDIDYNFETSTLTAYHLGAISAGSYQNQAFDEEGKLYSSLAEACSEDFKTSIDGLKEAFVAKKESALKLEADFSKEIEEYSANGSAVFMAAMK